MIFSVITFLSLATIGLVGYTKVQRIPRSMVIVAGLGFVLRIGFVVVDHVLNLFGDPGDAAGYELTLWFVTEQWRAGVLTAPLLVSSGPGHGGYFEILYSTVFAPIYVVFGRSPLLIRLAMALIGTLVVINTYILARDLFDTRSGLYAGTIAAVFPYWVYLSGILYRDMLIILLLSSMAIALVRWQRLFDQRALLRCLWFAGLALSLRLENLPAVGVMLGVAFYTRYETSLRQLAYTGVAGGTALLAFLQRFGDHVRVDRLAKRRLWLARENTGAYLTEIAYETVPELVAFTPIGVAYFTLVPFPWQAVNSLAVVAIVQNVVLWYPVVVLAILGARDAAHGPAGVRSTLPLVAFAVAGLFAYGLVEGNIGPAMRHRAQFQFVFFALAGVALGRRARFSVPSRLFNGRREKRN